jgi:hypothetical protein
MLATERALGVEVIIIVRMFFNSKLINQGEVEVKLVIYVLLFLTLGCAQLSKDGGKVRLASQVGESCTFLGSVESSYMVNNGDNDLKNQAAIMGGNWVVVTGYKWEGVFAGNKPKSGEVYKCPESKGSAKRVDSKIELDVNVNRDISSKANINQKTDDSINRLEKLKKLKDEKLINDSDYEQKKKEIIDSI